MDEIMAQTTPEEQAARPCPDGHAPLRDVHLEPPRACSCGVEP